MTSEDTADQFEFSSEQVYDVVHKYRQLYHEWTRASDDLQLQERLRAESRQQLSYLWEMLQEPLIAKAPGLLHHDLLQDILKGQAEYNKYAGEEGPLNTVAKYLYGHIIEELLKMQNIPEENLISHLVKRAEYRMQDEWRKVYKNGPRRSQPPGKQREDDVLVSGMAEAAMWPQEAAYLPSTHNYYDLSTLVDPQSYDTEKLIVEALDNIDIAEKIWAYWYETLSAQEFQIVELRIRRFPPVQYEEIAKTQGPGRSVGAVKMCWKRIKLRTIKYLRDQKLVDNIDMYLYGWLDDKLRNIIEK